MFTYPSFPFYKYTAYYFFFNILVTIITVTIIPTIITIPTGTQIAIISVVLSDVLSSLSGVGVGGVDTVVHSQVNNSSY